MKYFLDIDSQAVCQASHVRLSCSVSSKLLFFAWWFVQIAGLLLLLPSNHLQSLQDSRRAYQLGLHFIWSMLVLHWQGTPSLESPWIQGTCPIVSLTLLYPSWCWAVGNAGCFLALCVFSRKKERDLPTWI